MSYVTAIVLAAGKGERFKSKVPKPLVKIHSKPIIAYSLQAFSAHPSVKDIIVVVNAANRGAVIKIIERYRIDKISGIVKGGRRRQDSVKNGLKAVNPCSDVVLIHDSARPFINMQMVSSLIAAGQKHGAAIAAVPVKATIKVVSRSGKVQETLDRSRLWEIQTPQVFKKALLLEAYKRFSKLDVTDDAGLVEKLGAHVAIVMGAYTNIKITTPEDLAIAEVIAGKKTWDIKSA